VGYDPVIAVLRDLHLEILHTHEGLRRPRRLVGLAAYVREEICEEVRRSTKQGWWNEQNITEQGRKAEHRALKGEHARQAGDG
jgi:hypothetical protein